MATPVSSTAPTGTGTGATEQPKVGFMVKAQNNFNHVVEWVSKNTFSRVNCFSLKIEKIGEATADSTIKKTAKVFFALLASIALLPAACIASSIIYVKSLNLRTNKDIGATGATGSPAAATSADMSKVD